MVIRAAPMRLYGRSATGAGPGPGSGGQLGPPEGAGYPTGAPLAASPLVSAVGP